MSTTMEVPRPFVPGLGREWLLPLYDPLVSVLGIYRAHRALVDHASLRSWHRVLDIGCATGTLAVVIKRTHSEVEVSGLDPDAKALVRGSLKARNAGVQVRFDRGFSDELPYPDASFDRVFSSFMFHHLERGEQQQTLREARRVLRRYGRLLLVDFARPEVEARTLEMMGRGPGGPEDDRAPGARGRAPAGRVLRGGQLKAERDGERQSDGDGDPAGNPVAPQVGGGAPRLPGVPAGVYVGVGGGDDGGRHRPAWLMVSDSACGGSTHTRSMIAGGSSVNAA